jgi:hypothetical protein
LERKAETPDLHLDPASAGAGFPRPEEADPSMQHKKADTKMSKDATAVEFGEYEKRVLASGLGNELKAGWLKVYGKGGPKGPRIYVPLQKKVRRVDISGGLLLQAFTRMPPGGVFGSVKQCLDLTGTPEEVMERFEALLAALAEAPVPEKKPRAKIGAPRATGKSEGETPEGMTAEKAALIAKTSAEMGVPVSAETAEEMRELTAAEEDDVLERMTRPADELPEADFHGDAE